MKNLLEFIYENVNDVCLSEIHQPDVFKASFIFILEIEDDEFSLEDWKYTYAYITKSTNVQNSVKEIKEDLKKWASINNT